MSWAVTALWAVFAAVIFGAAWRTYDVLHRKKQRMASAYAIRLLVMGKATAVVAPAVGGFYLGLGLWRATLGPGSFTQSATLSLLVGGLVLFVAAVGGPPSPPEPPPPPAALSCARRIRLAQSEYSSTSVGSSCNALL